VPGAKAVADLLLAFEDYDKVFSDNVGIPESGNGTPDVLDEVRYELEWMFKMQDEQSGGVYHKVTGLNFMLVLCKGGRHLGFIITDITKKRTEFPFILQKGKENAFHRIVGFMKGCYFIKEESPYLHGIIQRVVDVFGLKLVIF
jgi:hypothetical protein